MPSLIILFFGVRNRYIQTKRVYVKKADSNTAEDAKNMELKKVEDSSGSATPYQLSAYVRLDDAMLNLEGLTSLTEEGKLGIFQKIATVVVTIEPITDPETTPVISSSP